MRKIRVPGRLVRWLDIISSLCFGWHVAARLQGWLTIYRYSVFRYFLN